MRILLPAGDGPADLEQLFTPPRPDWLRVCFVVSVDGAVSVRGASRGLQVPADTRLLGLLRGQADVVLVGAGTARADGYGPVRVSASRRARREAAGQRPVPPVAVVTGRGDPGLPAAFYAGEQRPLVLTTERAAVPVEGAEVIACGRDEVDLRTALAALAERGLRHVLCEGGSSLVTPMFEGGLVDELCLTVSPLLAGPGAGRLTAGRPWAGPTGLVLAGALEGNGALFLRYLAADTRSPVSSPARS